MLKDDRMMGMLTFVVIMVALGTLVQRAEFFQRLFGPSGPAAVLNPDVAEVRATEPVSIDVMSNDTGIPDDTEAQVIIATPPACGRAFVRAGRIEYVGTMGCVGEQTLRYGLRGNAETAELRILVKPADGSGKRRAGDARPGAEAAELTGAGAGAGAGTETTSPASASGSAAGAAAATDEGAGSREAMAATEGETAPDHPSAATAALALGRAGPPDGRDSAAAGSSGEAAAPRVTVPAGTTRTARATASSGPGAEAEVGAGAAGTPRGRAEACTTPPTLTLDLRPGALTEVAVDSPCDGGKVAELAYDGLRFAIPLDSRGSGGLTVPGLQSSTEATLALEGEEPMEFILPFEGIERVDRVAVAWQTSDGLALNAFEFGARPGGRGHLTPSAPRSFEAVRREGGGWLDTYRSAKGKGQRIEVYSFWRRYSGPSGVVRLALDPGSGGLGGCQGSDPRGSDYIVLRSIDGKLARSRLGRIAPLACTVLASGPDRYIRNAVDDLIVRHR